MDITIGEVLRFIWSLAPTMIVFILGFILGAFCGLMHMRPFK